MNHAPDRPPSPLGKAQRWAWFLDVDGTLLELEQHPDMVSADQRLLELLNGLNDCYDGAVALISGRSLEQIDSIFGALPIVTAASHGLEQRGPDGTVSQRGRPLPDAAREKVLSLAREHRGLVVEQKPHSVTLHYRARPELESTVLDVMESVRAGLDEGLRIQRGKMVAEILAGAADKGSAIRSFMEMPPFRGRRPVFAGDDVTDEAGFRVVNEMDGISIRIGESTTTAARWQLRDVAALRDWLRQALHLDENGTTSE